MCHEAQQILNVSYHPRHENLGNYQTKLYNGVYHQRVHLFYLYTKKITKMVKMGRLPKCTERVCRKDRKYLHAQDSITRKPFRSLYKYGISRLKASHLSRGRLLPAHTLAIFITIYYLWQDTHHNLAFLFATYYSKNPKIPLIT